MNINKTVKTQLDNQFMDETVINCPCNNTPVTFNISVCNCFAKPSINIPYSCLRIQDILPSGVEFDYATPSPTTSDPNTGFYEWNISYLENNQGYLSPGECYNILIHAIIQDGNCPWEKDNRATVMCVNPPGACKSYLKDDKATIYCMEGVPEINVDGSLSWINKKPGSTVTGSFEVSNVGEEGSNLNWEIAEYPEWGTWSFKPSNGRNLKPSDEPVKVEVEVKVTDEKNKEFTGKVKIVNIDIPEDYEILSVSLSTPKTKAIDRPFFNFLQNYPILHQLLLIFNK